MVIDIGDIIIGKLNSLPFIDKIAGVVKPIVYNSVGEGKKITKKTFPASCRTTWEQCESGRYKDLIPDSSKKSVLYLEDNGVRFVSRDGAKTKWKASYNLVCWLNMPKLGFEGCSYSSTAIASIISKLPVTPFNDGIFHYIQINPVGQQQKALNPFQKYSYDETVNQFLMYPFDYFVLLIEVDFTTDKRCLEVTPISSSTDCAEES